jgi:tetratricopeptide (TPR) repeat protein
MYLGCTYWKQEAFKLAESELTKSITLGKEEVPVDLYMARGESYLGLGRLDKAIADFTIGLAKRPKSEQFLVRRAESYCQTKRFKEAIKDADTFVSSSHSQRSYVFRGRIYLDCGNYQLAVKDFSDAIKLQPTSPDFYGLRARAYEKLGRNDLAKADRQKEAQLDSHPSELY